MKRSLSLLLALVLLLVCLASCAKDDVTEDSSADASGETSEDANLSGEKQETIVSIGKPYTTSYEPGPSYPDTYGTELCDGIYATGVASYTDARLSGWACANNGMLSVIFDLGEDSERLYKFGASYYSSQSAGLGPLTTGRVYASDDGETWSRIKSLAIPKYEDETIQQAWAILDEPIDARYVRFDLKSSTSWLFLDELIIIADVSGSSFHTQYLEELHAIYGENHLSASDLKAGSSTISRDLEHVNAAVGHSYTTSRPSGEAFPDSGRLLTDGVEPGAGYENGAFVGFEGGEALTIDLDLGKTVEGLSDFAVSMYQQSGLRQLLPYYVDFYISNDGKTYEKIGRVYAPDDLSVTNFTYGLHLRKGFSARMIRFELAKTTSSLFLVEEVSAYYYGTSSAELLYPALELPEVTEPQYWPNPSSKVTNLAAGLPYQIASGTEMLYSAEIDANTLPSAGVLTDGKYSPNLSFDNGFWNRTRNGSLRNIYFDFGYNSSITGFKINYLHYKPYAIIAPSMTFLYLSEDGVTWYSVGFAVCTATADQGIFSAELTLDVPLEARFACVTFSVAPHSYADEIEIYGSQAITGGTRKLSEAEGVFPAVEKKFMAPSEDILEGMADMALLYYTTITWDEEHILPYIAYLDKDGNIKDTMFDGLLFLPSGGVPSYGQNLSPIDEWYFQLEKDFSEDIHFGAAEKVTKRVKEELNLPADYKVKVYVTIPYTEFTETNFGDIDGDGVNEGYSTVEDRVRVISWYMDLYLERFAQAGYENIILGGFYWFNEDINYLDEVNEGLLLSAIAKEANAKGTQTFWIPYYTANGFSNWNAYGFSATCMQPNVVFSQNTSISQLYKAVDYIKALGMGIEIEADDSSLSQLEFYKRYLRYLGYGIDAGYMKDCMHMYYQGHDVYYQACFGETEMARNVYEATYGFIKGTLSAPEKIKDFTITCKAGEYVQGNLLEGIGELNYAGLTMSAEHGSVTVDANGGFLYVPYEGFTGTDTFSFHYNDYLTWSADTTVTVQVG